MAVLLRSCPVHVAPNIIVFYKSGLKFTSSSKCLFLSEEAQIFVYPAICLVGHELESRWCDS
jgi:hypothetical protein